MHIVTIRAIANFLLMLGYFILLFVNPAIGAAIKLIASVLLAYVFIKDKAWDMVFTLTFFSTLDLSYLIKLLF